MARRHAVGARPLTGSGAALLKLVLACLAKEGRLAVIGLMGGAKAEINRKALHGRFTEAAAQAKLFGAPVSLIMCDLDHFKRVNDEHGHDVGDLVLREAADRMRCTLRVFDMVYRLGGEEFLVLLPGASDELAFGICERIRRAIEEHPWEDVAPGLRVTASFGVATGQPDDGVTSLIGRADAALYAAKHAGRNQVVGNTVT